MGGILVLKENIITYIKTAIIIIGILLFFGAGIGTSRTIPDNAIVYANDYTKTYVGEPSITNKDKKNLRKVTINEMHKSNYNPEDKSVENGDFTEDGRSLTGTLLEHIGLLHPLKSRWNQNGTWNY